MEHPQALKIAEQFGTPVYVYFEDALGQAAQQALAFQAPFGLQVSYAMKANPNRAIIELFYKMGIHIDASSEYEALRALDYGIPGEHILLTSQEFPRDLAALIQKGVQFNACSLHQLEKYGEQFPGTEVSLRINPGEGSGAFAKTNVGGSESSFGIWHEHLAEATALLEKHELTVKRIHSHIGSGADPEVWKRSTELMLTFLERFPTATILNLGGGFKVARYEGEKQTDLQAISEKVSEALRDFADKTGRQIKLEIEPGTYLTANAGVLLSRIQDMTETDRFKFIKLDCGMTEIIRPSYYGAQHRMSVISQTPRSETQEYIVVGHCCESGDLLTPEPGNGDVPKPRLLQKAEIGDLFLIEGTGAYCASMSTKGYNSFPEAKGFLLRKDNTIIQV
ncbi:MAG: diaminopimelate decarboxylase [Patescibacteria group bacterium]